MTFRLLEFQTFFKYRTFFSCYYSKIYIVYFIDNLNLDANQIKNTCVFTFSFLLQVVSIDVGAGYMKYNKQANKSKNAGENKFLQNAGGMRETEVKCGRITRDAGDLAGLYNITYVVT